MSNEYRVITLTGRPPVRIRDDDWEVIAKATDEEHDGQVRCQANRVSNWAVRVRRHEDGRHIVSATYSYSSNWQGARGYSAKGGVLIPSGATAQQVCDAVREVCEGIAGAECDGSDAERWPTMAAECIADMPAEPV